MEDSAGVEAAPDVDPEAGTALALTVRSLGEIKSYQDKGTDFRFSEDQREEHRVKRKQDCRLVWRLVISLVFLLVCVVLLNMSRNILGPHDNK